MFRPPSTAPGLPGLRAAVLADARAPREPRGGQVLASVVGGGARAAQPLYGLPSPAQPCLAPVPAASPRGDRMEELVARAKAGDSDAFAGLYDKYLDVVFRYISYRVGSRPLAEDLTSETFLRALRGMGGFTWQGRDFGAWLITIARNLIADHYKSSRFRLEITIADMVTTEGNQEAAESPEGAVLRHFTNSALLAAVKQLNPAQQECLVLRFLQGLSVAETAKIMGKNEGAIKTLQYRAVRTLAQLLPEGTR
ncbi:MAG: ECF subfamily RNA polymerase sigma factor, BldN family [Sporichthyaceae bacterium]